LWLTTVSEDKKKPGNLVMAGRLGCASPGLIRLLDMKESLYRTSLHRSQHISSPKKGCLGRSTPYDQPVSMHCTVPGAGKSSI